MLYRNKLWVLYIYYVLLSQKQIFNFGEGIVIYTKFRSPSFRHVVSRNDEEINCSVFLPEGDYVQGLFDRNKEWTDPQFYFTFLLVLLT